MSLNDKVQFSPDVVNHLSDQLASPDVPPSRQSTLDEQVRSRIQQELGRLRDEEQHVREEIERTLEKENLDRERNMAGGEAEGSEGAGHVKSSVTLLGDVDEIRRKVDRFQSKRELEDYASIKSLGEAVATCYRYVLFFAQSN
jgi:altered-inheritance-of-mitochondria protein 13